VKKIIAIMALILLVLSFFLYRQCNNTNIKLDRALEAQIKDYEIIKKLNVELQKNHVDEIEEIRKKTADDIIAARKEAEEKSTAEQKKWNRKITELEQSKVSWKDKYFTLKIECKAELDLRLKAEIRIKELEAENYGLKIEIAKWEKNYSELQLQLNDVTKKLGKALNLSTSYSKKLNRDKIIKTIAGIALAYFVGEKLLN
jgi:hypothetical protein